MALTLAEQVQASEDATLRIKVRGAIGVACDVIRGETTGSNLANRKKWAKLAAFDPERWVVPILRSAVAQNRTAANLAAVLAATDSAIQTAVDAVIDIFADGTT